MKITLDELRQDPLINGLALMTERTSSPVRDDAKAQMVNAMAVIRKSNRILYAPLALFVPVLLGPVLGVLPRELEDHLTFGVLVLIIAAGAFVIMELQHECARLVKHQWDTSKNPALSPDIAERVAEVREVAANRIDLLAVLDYAQTNGTITDELLDLVEFVAKKSGERHDA